MAHSENPHAGQGSVLLDIGGDVGAVVVTMPASLDGVEVEIRPVGAGAHEPGHSHWPHVAVLARPTPSGPVPSLVFGEVLAGRYELYVRPHGEVKLIVEVTGGEVTQAVWSA